MIAGVVRVCQTSTRDAVALVALLKICAKDKDLLRGSDIHADIARRGLLQNSSHLGSTLVNLYAKCGALAKAQEVFDSLFTRNVVSWNALISGYAQQGYGEEALKWFERMQLGGISPDRVTFLCIMKACGSTGAADKVEEVHTQIVKDGLLEKDIAVGNALVDMYFKCGLPIKAREVFDMLLLQDVVTWNALIAGHVQHDHGDVVLNCFHQMQLEGFSPDAFTFSCILKACGNLGAADKGKKVHAQIVNERFLRKDIVVANALIDMYAKFGLLGKAQEVFADLPAQNIISWNVLIAGHTQIVNGEEALNLFNQMQLKGFSADAVTFTCILKACSSIGMLDKGREIHAKIVMEGLFEKNIVVINALVDFYAKCNLLEEAQGLFDKLLVRDLISWSALIAGYAQHMHGQEALNCFERMQVDGFSPDAVVYACILKPCGRVGGAHKGQEIHREIVIVGFPENNVVVANALVDMYCKCSMLPEAQAIFDKLQVRDEVSWNSLISGYAQHMHGEEAVDCFEQMQLEGLLPSSVTFVCALGACGSIGAASKGHDIHVEIMRNGSLVIDTVIGTALVDMYANCGLLSQAWEVFDGLPFRDLICWNALMAGYGQLGKDEVVSHLLLKMIEEGKKPNTVTLTIVLNACSHGGLLCKGQMYFETLTRDHGIVPTLEHHACMVDLFGRAGHLDKAVAMIKEMAFSDNLMMWHTILGACQKWGDTKLGRWAFDHAEQLNEQDASSYICMSNIYAADSWKEIAAKMEAM